MSKVLIIAKTFCLPAQMGTSVDINGRVNWLLSEGHQVSYLCFTNTHEDELPTLEHPNFSRAIQPHIPRWQPYGNAEAKTVIQQAVYSFEPDVVWVEYADMFSNLRGIDLRGARTVVRSHNLEAAHYWDKNFYDWRIEAPEGWLNRSSSFLRWLTSIARMWSTIYRIEARTHRQADVIVHIGWQDLRWSRRLYPGFKKNRHWIPPFFSETPAHPGSQDEKLHAVYVGSNFTNNVNLAGARFLIDELAPACWARFSDRILFHIVGRNSEVLLSELAPPENIRLHGFVDDLTTFMSHMDLAVIPVPIGWGCKIKMAEALAKGLPVVGSSESFRGIRTDLFEVLSANNVDAYIDCFSQILQTGALHRFSSTNRKSYFSLQNSKKNLLSELIAKQPACGNSFDKCVN